MPESVELPPPSESEDGPETPVEAVEPPEEVGVAENSPPMADAEGSLVPTCGPSVRKVSGSRTSVAAYEEAEPARSLASPSGESAATGFDATGAEDWGSTDIPSAPTTRVPESDENENRSSEPLKNGTTPVMAEKNWDRRSAAEVRSSRGSRTSRVFEAGGLADAAVG